MSETFFQRIMGAPEEVGIQLKCEQMILVHESDE